MCAVMTGRRAAVEPLLVAGADAERGLEAAGDDEQMLATLIDR